ncbi:MAG TPA: succinate dehydrogenase cytochrome b subunit [Planctomycetota bacterium]|nr:succinate dehydrogenase cytochrome b subunit [Planctomycetota bacterium]
MKISSIFKKVLMALSGLALVGFLVAHLAGNLLLYKGNGAFNGYAEMLEHNPLIIPAELALIAIFVIHVYNAARLTIENKTARPIVNAERKTAGESTFSSRTMWATGLIVFAFIILHVWQFKYGDKSGSGGLWGLVISKFQEPAILGIYVVAMLVLGFHLAHGISSAFQSLGLLSQNRRKLRGAGLIVGWILALGFMSLPLYAFFAKPVATISATNDHMPKK